jgi:hypothetical protein
MKTNINNLVEAYLNTLTNISEDTKSLIKTAFIAGYNQRDVDDAFENDIQSDEEDVFADYMDDITPMNLTDEE